MSESKGAANSGPTPSAVGNRSDQFEGKEKQKDVRTQNFVAAKAVAMAVRTSLGPKGMDKMITSAQGETIITNDGATILAKLEPQHPAARMVRKKVQVIDRTRNEEIDRMVAPRVDLRSVQSARCGSW